MVKDIHPKRALGQHFLADINTARWIVRQAGLSAEDRVIEIGPGTGVMTRAILETGAHVIAIEKDPGLCEHLKSIFGESGNIEIIQGDATRFPWESLTDAARPAVLLGNLPYNVSTLILRHLLTKTRFFKKWQFLFQKEVAERICAKAGDSNYGILSVFTQSVTRPSILKILLPRAFFPPPKVDSALVSFEMLPFPASSPMEDRLFIQIVKAAFSHRRKMLKNNLKHLFRGDIEAVEACLDAIGLKGTLRAQNLTVQDYLKLAKILAAD